MTDEPLQKIYHRAALQDPQGNVSALCFGEPHPIDLERELWTIRDKAVTCPKCKAILRRKVET